MGVAYGVLVGGLGAYADDYMLTLFGSAGYIARAVHGPGALFAAMSRAVDLALIDLPGAGELPLLAELRARSSSALIVCGPHSDRLVVSALGHGADDYVARPFRSDELLARVRAQLRRRQRHAPHPFSVGRLRFDLAARQVQLDGRSLDLSPAELALLATLAEAPGQVFAADYLIDQVWGGAQLGDPGPLVAALTHLRLQIEPDLRWPQTLVGDLGSGLWLASS